MVSKAAVMGWPVSHSLSPRLHNYWLEHYGINGEYTALEVKPEQLGEAMAALKKNGFRGVNLTLPHKELVLPMLDHVDSEARVIGAVNTVIVKDGQLHGTNTDAYGFIANIRPHLPAGKNKAVVLGAGGAAKAVCYALSKEGFTSIVILNRTQDKAHTLAQSFPGAMAETWEQRNEALAGADLLVNATSLGMKGKGALEIDLTALPEQALVTDIVYSPLVTELLAAAYVRGNPVVDGLGMLLHQAVPAFEAWFGLRPEVTEALRRHVLGAP